MTVDDNVNATGNVVVTLRGDDAKLSVAIGNNIISSAADVTLTADKMDLVGTVASVSTGVVTVQPFSAGQLINLGSTSDAAANTLELSDAELDNITTGKLIIGRDDASAAGTITVSQVVSLALLAAPVVVLITGAKIDDTVAGSISASKLALRSKTGVGSAATPLTLESVGEVAAINGTSGGLFLDSNDTVTVGTVDGTIGIKNIGGGAITIETFANNANIVVNQSILTNGDIKLDADKNGTGSGTDGGTITIASTAQLAVKTARWRSIRSQTASR